MNPRLEPEVFGIKALEGGAEKYKGPEGVMGLGRTTTHEMGKNCSETMRPIGGKKVAAAPPL